MCDRLSVQLHQHRQYIHTQAVSGVRSVTVRGILPPADPFLAQKSLNLRTPDRQQWADDPSARGPHPSHSPDIAATDHLPKHGFRLVFHVVRHGDLHTTGTVIFYRILAC